MLDYSWRVWIALVTAVAMASLVVACNKPASDVATDQAKGAAPASTADRYEIEGRVLLPDSTDASGIQVYIPGSSFMVITDSAGHYVLREITPGSKSVMARMPGYKPARLGEIQIEEDADSKRFFLADTTLESQTAAAPGPASADSAAPAATPPVTAPTLGSIQGKISFGDDVPAEERTDLANARVELDGTQLRTFADSSGNFLFNNIEPRGYPLVVTLPGFNSVRTDVNVAPGGGPTRAEIILTSAEAVAGGREIVGSVELFNLDGSPLDDFSVVSIFLREAPERKVRVEQDGSFRIGSLGPQVYTIYAAADGFDSPSESVDLTDVSTADVTLTLTATVPRADVPGTIRGRALKGESTDGDMSGISVALAGTSYSAVTSKDGSYEISRVPPAVYDVIAQAEGYQPSTLEGVELSAGEDLQIDDLVILPIKDYPVVLETDPEDNTRDFIVQYEMPITVRFSKKMRGDSLKRSVTIAPPVAFRVFTEREHPKSDFDLMFVAIDGASANPPVRFDNSYRLTISTGAEDFEGLHLQEPFVLAFRTGKAAVIGSAPPNGAQGAVLNPGMPLEVSFNARLRADSIEAREIRIRPSLAATPNMNILSDPRTGWSRLHLQAVWRPDTEYSVTIPRRVKTDTGQYFSNTPYVLRFKTADVFQFPPLNPAE